MIKTKNLKRGFSLVELMIVVAVMAILATVGFFAYNNFQKTARDSKRKADLKAVSTAVQAYYSESGKYPVPSGATADSHEAANDVSNGSYLTGVLAKYGGKVPLAPDVTGVTGENKEYQYAYDYTDATDNGKTFALCAQLETLPAGSTTAQMWKISSADPSGSMVGNGVCAAP